MVEGRSSLEERAFTYIVRDHFVASYFRADSISIHVLCGDARSQKWPYVYGSASSNLNFTNVLE